MLESIIAIVVRPLIVRPLISCSILICSSIYIWAIDSYRTQLWYVANEYITFFRSYSWSANICGHKKWILYPPGSEKYLKDNHGNLVFDLTSSQIQDTKKFPHFHKAPQPIVVNQKEGEIIFVPRYSMHFMDCTESQNSSIRKYIVKMLQSFYKGCFPPLCIYGYILTYKALFAIKIKIAA